MRRAMAFLLLASLAACGEQTSAAPVADDEPAEVRPPVVTTADGEPMVTCGGPPGWPASVLADGVQGVLSRDEVEAAFREMLADPVESQELELSFLREGAENTRWRLLSHEGDQFTLGLGDWGAQGPARDAYIFGMRRTAEGWEWQGGGSCWHLGPVLSTGHDWVQVAALPAGLDRTSTTVGVEVSEMACTGSRDPAPFLHDPVVVESPEEVVVYWTTKPPEGNNTCPGNPWVERTVELSEPLGDRPLLDGRLWPPRPVVPAQDADVPQ